MGVQMNCFGAFPFFLVILDDQEDCLIFEKNVCLLPTNFCLLRTNICLLPTDVCLLPIPRQLLSQLYCCANSTRDDLRPTSAATSAAVSTTVVAAMDVLFQPPLPPSPSLLPLPQLPSLPPMPPMGADAIVIVATATNRCPSSFYHSHCLPFCRCPVPLCFHHPPPMLSPHCCLYFLCRHAYTSVFHVLSNFFTSPRRKLSRTAVAAATDSAGTCHHCHHRCCHYHDCHHCCCHCHGSRGCRCQCHDRRYYLSTISKKRQKRMSWRRRWQRRWWTPRQPQR